MEEERNVFGGPTPWDQISHGSMQNRRRIPQGPPYTHCGNISLEEEGLLLPEEEDLPLPEEEDLLLPEEEALLLLLPEEEELLLPEEEDLSLPEERRSSSSGIRVQIPVHEQDRRQR